MIRFIDLTGQIAGDEDKYFAWFDTVRDEFLEFDGTQIFHDWEEFEEDFYNFLNGEVGVRKHNFTDLDRFRGLFRWKEVGVIKTLSDIKVGLTICCNKFPYKPIKIVQIFIETKEVRVTPLGEFEDQTFNTKKLEDLFNYRILG